MNRTEEYKSLLADLATVPTALDHVMAHAEARVKKTRRVRRSLAIPGGSCAAFLLVFTVLVNVSTPFAQACAKIPVLRELSSAVAFSPSLTAAVENDYAQPIGLEQTDNGVTMRIAYVIVDQKQLDIFYTMTSNVYSNLLLTTTRVNSTEGTALPGVITSSNSPGTPETALRQLTVDYENAAGDIPGSIVLTCAVSGKSDMAPENCPPPTAEFSAPAAPAPSAVANFKFTLTFDPAFTRQGEMLTINKSFVLDGQSLTVTTVEVYPTHIRLNLSADPKNTAWLKSLTCCLKDDNGKQFRQVCNGVNAMGEAGTPAMISYWLESSYFSNSKNLTLDITGAVWLDKAHERVKVNLAEGKADYLPEGVQLREAERQDNTWRLTFTAPRRDSSGIYQIFLTNYYEESGTEHSYATSSAGAWVHRDASTGQYVQESDIFQEQFALTDYPYDTVYLSPAFSRAVTLETPIVISVK